MVSTVGIIVTIIAAAITSIALLLTILVITTPAGDGIVLIMTIMM